MEDDVKTLFLQTAYGHLPDLQLPPSFNGSAVAVTAPAPGGGSARTVVTTTNERDSPGGRAGNSDPAWYGTNPAPIQAWKLPSGKEFKSVFNFNDQRRNHFTQGWPKTKHHRSGEPRFLCIRYQVEGVCKGRCRGAHKPSDKLTTEEHDIISGKLEAAWAFRGENTHSN